MVNATSRVVMTKKKENQRKIAIACGKIVPTLANKETIMEFVRIKSVLLEPALWP
jgi:hypothetical protein